MKTNINRNRLILVVLALAALFAPFVANAKEESKAGTKPYPLKACIVTDNDLGSMGDERSFVYEGQEIKICCKPCEKKFLKNPAKYLAKLTPPSETKGK